MKKIKELIDLNGRKALVTGGAGHIGAVAVETLVELGAEVAIWDLHYGFCDETARKINGKGYPGNAVAYEIDLSDEQAVRKKVGETVNDLGGIDIIVHSAAFIGTTQYPGWAVPFKAQSMDAWDKSMRVNLESIFIIVQESSRHLKQSGHSSVILISSIYGIVAPDKKLYEGTDMVSPVAYGASKSGIIQLSKYLASELSPEVRVNCVVPGGVWRNQDAKFVERYEDRTPLKRMAKEEDIKGAIGYLASDLSAYVTGTDLVVDGGFTAW